MAVNITMGIFFLGELECKDRSKFAIFCLLYIAAFFALLLPFCSVPFIQPWRLALAYRICLDICGGVI